eukprot:CAMPEP_0181204198 /NCGR_PEP_ID=MMETSP1096-20121128/19803_1 /TAXON_ID=156174 ORGANISM="Chrysochromulina ericina, Strain CCMP281" /NCGR_SAMPLE_ID=MMETSP1096 /ASSEMBLY_ACC=CAM_ASM_000453 /LENGTH=97 /DNA_ID=CAMNT_0023294873 /DNA_START=695 /DNA_END=985 /DNA_ORIENTATION=-
MASLRMRALTTRTAQSADDTECGDRRLGGMRGRPCACAMGMRHDEMDVALRVPPVPIPEDPIRELVCRQHCCGLAEAPTVVIARRGPDDPPRDSMVW